MTTRLGSDPDQLEDLAAFLRSRSLELSDEITAASAMVRSLPWLGPDADRLHLAWRRHARDLGHAAGQLGVASDRLIAHAREQRDVSSSGRDRYAAATTAYGHWRDRQDVLRRADGLSQAGHDAAFAAFWDSLAADERRLLMLLAPGLVLRNGDTINRSHHPLSAEQKRQAVEQWISATSDTVDRVISRTAYEFEGGVRTKLVDLQLDARASISVLDRSARPIVADLDFDASGVYLAAGLEGIGAMRYAFETREEAETFLAGLADRLTPGPSDLRSALDTPWAPAAGVATSMIRNINTYLDGYRERRIRARVGGGLEARLDLAYRLGDADVDLTIEGSAGATFDHETGELSIYHDAGGEMGGSLPVGSEAQPSVDVEADVRTEVVLDPSTREILAVRVHAEATAEVGADLHGVFSPLGLPDDLFAGLAGGHTVTADVVFDLTDPYVLSNIDQIVKGDLGGLPNLYDNSAATVGIATITTNDVVGFGVVVADYSVNVINSETILRVDKIPGHGWERTG